VNHHAKDSEDLVRRVFRCSGEVAADIKAHMRMRAYSARATIVHQGEACHDVYLLVIGRARSCVIASDGALVLFYDFSPGDLFGALNALTDSGHFSEISALEDLEAAVFAGTDFLVLVERHACVGLLLSRVLLRQLEHVSARMLSRTMLSATGRVYEELLRLARASGGDEIVPPPVLAELAVRIHSTRETVSRTISALERRGIVRRTPDTLVIVAPRRLAEMVI
jgi:CRP/FNR family transcriptional regulator, cyclic AMP receptor protein